MSHASKPTVANYREFKDQHKGHRLRFSRSGEPKIEEAYSTHLVVVGKRNPFAEPDTGTIPCDKKSETEPKGPLAE